MAGHSKWANIKRHKAKQDEKRGKLYSKLIREVTVAAKIGGGEIGSNPRLRAAVDKALEANMTRDVLDRAIKRGVGGMEGEVVDEIRYEGYGPLGVAVLVDCMTNNRNRTVSEVRHIFSKYGGNLGTDGSVSYLFKKQGLINFNNKVDHERLMEHALELGAEDVIVNPDHTIDVIVVAEQLNAVKDAFIRLNFQPLSAEVTFQPTNYINIQHKEEANKVLHFIEALEDLDDVQMVYTNVDIMDEILNELD